MLHIQDFHKSWTYWALFLFFLFHIIWNPGCVFCLFRSKQATLQNFINYITNNLIIRHINENRHQIYSCGWLHNNGQIRRRGITVERPLKWLWSNKHSCLRRLFNRITTLQTHDYRNLQLLMFYWNTLNIMQEHKYIYSLYNTNRCRVCVLQYIFVSY